MPNRKPEDAFPYAHWMLREIFEQPGTLARTFSHFAGPDGFRPETCASIFSWLERVEAKLVIAASGSSRHAGLLGELSIQNLSGIPVDVEYASEYSYELKTSADRAAVLVISQSGETADTLAALRKATQAGLPTLAITNVRGSSMDREAAASMPTLAGRERAIPATKSFTAQVLNLYLLALMAADARGTMDSGELNTRLGEIAALSGRIEAQIEGWNQAIRGVAQQYSSAKSFLFLGRGIHYAIAREGALKLKESAYLHAEGYPSGELKHGPNALVAEGTPLVMLATVDRADPDSVQRYGKVVQLMRDMRRQGAGILAIANTGDAEVANLASHVVCVDETREVLLGVCETIPLQMLAYWVAVHHGVDVDNPRNLTKAVLSE